LAISSTLLNDINPSGLNGEYNGGGATVPINFISQGAQAVVTAAPIPNWRVRLSAAYTGGTIGTTKSYPQIYTDQFHANAAGDVTYADGTIVYVPATFNSKATQRSYSSTDAPAGSIPLTIAAHGPILTGNVGLPISALQINPALAGISVPGLVEVAQSGQATTGYPEPAWPVSGRDRPVSSGPSPRPR